MLVWIATALASPPPGFEELKVWNACVIYKRDRTETRPSAMRAECTWPDVDPVRFGKMLRDYGGYDGWIWPVAESEVRRIDGERSLVYQLQHIWGISDREVLLWATRQELPTGGVRASWVTATEEPLQLRDGTIRTPHNEGFWQVEPGATGSLVVHQIEVDAGGVSLPGWLIRAIQSRGLGRLMDEARDHALEKK